MIPKRLQVLFGEIEEENVENISDTVSSKGDTLDYETFSKMLEVMDQEVRIKNCYYEDFLNSLEPIEFVNFVNTPYNSFLNIDFPIFRTNNNMTPYIKPYITT